MITFIDVKKIKILRNNLYNNKSITSRFTVKKALNLENIIFPFIYLHSVWTFSKSLGII